jgi:lysozyme family protein
MTLAAVSRKVGWTEINRRATAKDNVCNHTSDLATFGRLTEKNT